MWEKNKRRRMVGRMDILFIGWLGVSPSLDIIVMKERERAERWNGCRMSDVGCRMS